MPSLPLLSDVKSSIQMLQMATSWTLALGALAFVVRIRVVDNKIGPSNVIW